MTDNLNSVKTARTSGYHHGNLRAELIAAAEHILEESGVAGFSLRAAARRCGVSPAAPAHHFGDARGLLTAVAARGFERLAQCLEAGGEDAAGGDRVTRIGWAYVRFARDNPGVFAIMWSADHLDRGDDAYLQAGRRAFNVLERAVTGREVLTATGPRLPQATTIAAWAMAHGLARLALDGALDTASDELLREVLSLTPRPRAG